MRRGIKTEWTTERTGKGIRYTGENEINVQRINEWKKEDGG
jgi:hypothetical protein